MLRSSHFHQVSLGWIAYVLYRFQKSPLVIHPTPLQRVPEHRGPTPWGATKEL